MVRFPGHFEPGDGVGQVAEWRRRAHALFAVALPKEDPRTALLEKQQMDIYREAIQRWDRVVALGPTSEYAWRARRELHAAATLARVTTARAKA